MPFMPLQNLWGSIDTTEEWAMAEEQPYVSYSLYPGNTTSRDFKKPVKRRKGERDLDLDRAAAFSYRRE